MCSLMKQELMDKYMKELLEAITKADAFKSFYFAMFEREEFPHDDVSSRVLLL